MSTYKKDRPLGFGALLIELREAAGLSKSKLARGANITLGALWKYENGHVNPGRDMLRRFAKALDMDYMELVERVSDVDVAS